MQMRNPKEADFLNISRHNQDLNLTSESTSDILSTLSQDRSGDFDATISVLSFMMVLTASDRTS